MPKTTSTSNRAEELFKEISKAEQELAALEAELPQLEAAVRAGRAEFRHAHNPVDLAQTEALERFTAAENRASELRSQLKDWRRVHAHYERAANAERDQRAAITRAAKAKGALDELEAKRLKLVKRIAEAEASRDEALMEAEGLERDANEAYALACENGTDEEVSAALARVGSAQAATRVARERGEQSAGLVTALQEKLAQIEARATDVRAELDAARADQGAALLAEKRQAWDDMVDQLVRVGCELVAAAKATGRDALDEFGNDLRITRFAPDRHAVSWRSFKVNDHDA